MSLRDRAQLAGLPTVALLDDEDAFCQWLEHLSGRPVVLEDHLPEVCDPLALCRAVGLLEAHLLDGALPAELLEACRTVADLWWWARARRVQ